MAAKAHNILPGFIPTLGLTLLYTSIIVLIPMAALGLKASGLSWDEFCKLILDERILASFKVTFGAAAVSAVFNLIFGALIAWVLARYRFWGRSILDAAVDLPFALPTAVAGIALTTVWAETGWIGEYLAQYDIKVAYTFWGITLAMTFIGIPFVVRTVQPVLEELDEGEEEASMILGGSRLTTFRRVILPSLVPALLTGFALAFARAVGEYGSVVFISGNMPYETEIAPLLIITQLEEYNYAAATAIAVVMLGLSFIILLAINLIQWLFRRKYAL